MVVSRGEFDKYTILPYLYLVSQLVFSNHGYQTLPNRRVVPGEEFSDRVLVHSTIVGHSLMNFSVLCSSQANYVQSVSNLIVQYLNLGYCIRITVKKHSIVLWSWIHHFDHGSPF